MNFAIIGFGGLGKVHFENSISLMNNRDDVKLVAICDVDEERFHQKIETNLGGETHEEDLTKYNLYTDVLSLFERENLDFVITALPTNLHEKIAVMALQRGIHVFSEKPMARSLDECKRMVDTATMHNKKLMIGQCLRFHPHYRKAKEFIDNKTFGKVIRAEFKRYSNTPKWSWQNWMLDFDKSGGCALDLHVHDLDIINWVFGRPLSVKSTATHYILKFESIFTEYEYKNLLVTAAADWSLTGYPFTPAFMIVFEEAVVEWNKGDLMVYPIEGDAYKADVSDENCYYNEINEFIDCIKYDRESESINPRSTMQTIEIAFAEIKSAEEGIKVYL